MKELLNDVSDKWLVSISYMCTISTEMEDGIIQVIWDVMAVSVHGS